MTRADARALLASRERRAGTVESDPYRPVLGLVGLLWSLVTLAVLGIMLLPFLYGAMDVLLHH